VSGSDGVRVSIDVAVSPAVAFEAFTAEIDAWWGRGPRFRFLAPYAGTLRLEPGLGGRLLHEADAPPRVFVVGRILAWEPPRRLGLTWRLPNFAPDQVTRVEIVFDPIEAGTRVTVAHDGWDGLPLGHPARHGQVGRDFVVFRGRWWGDLLTALRRHVERALHAGTGGQP
jgi:uncharacterized protein YndB with AHSA1/START domain